MRPFSRSLTPVPPNLFGAYNRTGLMIALANAHVARRVELAKHFGAELVHSRKRKDERGLILKWPIGMRGYALALNPAFPLLRELRTLLRALSKEYPISIDTDVLPEEAVIPQSAIPAQPNMELLFDSPVRTLLLVTLEALGGKVVQRVLCHCVPGQFYNSTVTALRHFLRDGVLQRRGRIVSFSGKSWTPALRKLLRAYLREQPAVEQSILRQTEHERRRTKVLPQYHLLGPPSVERQLIALAQHGPMSYAEVMASAKTHADRSFHIFENMGIIASSGTDAGA
jgi:hypothetical protein